jgi:glycosyltransferase involved in cell wall biosynthesis
MKNKPIPGTDTRLHILIIAPYPPGEAPSQRFRFEQYLNALDERGILYDYEPFISAGTWKILHLPGRFVAKAMGILDAFARRFLLLFRLHAYDFVFIHREASHIGPPIFEWLIAKVFRKKIIFDFDDAIWLPNYSKHNESFHQLKMYGKIHWTLRWTYRVSAGNAYLANFARPYQPDVVVLPTTIDTQNHHARVKDYSRPGPLVIGWTGTLTTIRYLHPLLPIIAELEKKYDFEFEIIANENPHFDLKSFRFRRWQKESEIDDLLRFSVGLMPLEDDQWAKGKCGFKALQYMALGIPALVSPVGVNTDIVEHGVNGYICDSPMEWKETIVQLLQNPILCTQLGLAARKTIVDRYSVLANTEKFVGLFR